MKKLEDIKILVIGDIMLDKYIIGEVERICPEAPVPIVKVQKKKYSLGGCGNVSKNISELGTKTTTLSIVGDDDSGLMVQSLMNKIVGENNLITSGVAPTTKKTRVVANHRMTQMLRIDEETFIDFEAIEELKEKINEIEYDPDVIIISDYDKGVIRRDVIKHLKQLNSKIVVDPKPNNFNIYGNVFLMSPNEKEYIKLHLEELEEYPEWILRTLGSKGMKLSQKPFDKDIKIKSTPVDVYNVSGAGDTVIAILSVCLALGIDVLTSSKIANECARYVVTRPGTSTVPKSVFNAIMKNFLGAQYNG